MSGERSRAEKRLLRRMEKHGAAGFWIWRSRETGMKRYVRPAAAHQSTPTTESKESSS